MNILFVLALSFSSLLFSIDYDYIRVTKKLASPNWIRTTGFIEDHLQSENYLVGYVPKGAPLTRSDWNSITTLDAREWSHQLFDVDTLNEIDPPRNEGGIYEDFHTYETLTAELKLLASKHPNLVTLESAGKTVEGREMWLLRVTNKNVALPSKPKLLFISSMHGDEVTGKEMMVYLSRLLLSSYVKDARISNLVDNNELFIMPSMNPDGTERQQRFNANGVDLNRDFPLLAEAPMDPARAIEVKNIQALHQKHHFLTAINFHGGEICINIPWDSKQNHQGALFGDDALMMSLARYYAGQNVPMENHHSGNFNHGVTYGYEWYPVYGGMQDWATHFFQSTHATVEISQVKWPSASSLPGFWKDNQQALLGYLEKSSTGVHLKVTGSSGELLPVEIGIASAHRTLKYAGYVHRPSAASNETVTIKSAGYQTKTISVTPLAFNGSFINVKLDK